MKRILGRVTRDDIRSAGLRRWDGRGRITTDWVNVFHEPELCWPTGDCLVYLREPGQSSRGPAFRVHTAFLRVKGFDDLADQCVVRNNVHAGSQCVLPNCPGCNQHDHIQELYLPAPRDLGLEEIFNHHITTRNFFAWLYNRPLTGRSLGDALISLKDRVQLYRPDNQAQNVLEVISFAESQRYLDFRECVDHALAILRLAENIEVEDLWIDAFSHCVGMSHRGLRASLEYAGVTAKSKTLINRARGDMEFRLERIQKNIDDFFEQETSESFLSLPQAARDHLERFRTFLKKTYSDQFGSWPPARFSDEAVQQSLYRTLHSDFLTLYQHLVDSSSSTDLAASDITRSGGVCTLQNLQAFDKKYSYESLPQPLPLLPKPNFQNIRAQQRRSWNPVNHRKNLKRSQRVYHKDTLIEASNQSPEIMDCGLVRAYTLFEATSVDEDYDSLSPVEGRKIRWILIYAILQALQSVAQAPKQVRNTNRISYPLCCRIPDQMPWSSTPPTNLQPSVQSDSIIPDTHHSHTNASSTSLPDSNERSTAAKARRRTLPANLPTRLKASLSLRSRADSRASSLRRMLSRKTSTPAEDPLPRHTSFLEIQIRGYGNGLSVDPKDEGPPSGIISRPVSRGGPHLPKPVVQELDSTAAIHELPSPDSDRHGRQDNELAKSTPSMSRESSSASSNSSTWRKNNAGSSDGDHTEPQTPTSEDDNKRDEQIENLPHNPTQTSLASAKESSPAVSILKTGRDESVMVVDDEKPPMSELPASIHVNPQTWDVVIGQKLAESTAVPVGTTSVVTA